MHRQTAELQICFLPVTLNVRRVPQAGLWPHQQTYLLLYTEFILTPVRQTKEVTINPDIAPFSTLQIQRKTKLGYKKWKLEASDSFSEASWTIQLLSYPPDTVSISNHTGKLINLDGWWKTVHSPRLFGREPGIVRGLYQAPNLSGWENLRNKEVPRDSCRLKKWYKRWILR